MNIVLDDKTLCDLECILSGVFDPIETFMNKSDWENVCKSMHLSNGKFFPLPVNLAVKNDVKVGDEVILVDNTNYPLCLMTVTETYVPDLNWECKNAYGTDDDNHPFVNYKMSQKDKVYISGPLKKINDIRHYDFNNLRLTPKEVREYISKNNWNTVVGFQTRNPMHKAHYELTKYALNKTGVKDAKLFLNPVVGETQTVDIDYFTRVQVYKKIINKYNENVVKLGLLPLAMRMAGPREACLHALIRKNYGCTHFVVGRDHAGPSYKKKDGSNFYGHYDAQDLLFKHADEIGITPIVSKMIVYNVTKNIYQPIDEVDSEDKTLSLSGSEVRRRLRENEEIPDWFSFPEVVELLKKSVKKRGTCYYLIGLSGCGKTTIANCLKTKLLEKNHDKEITILDGDIVRQNLSKGLGFSRGDRSINVRRIGFVASEIVKHGGIVICANIAPYQNDRDFNKKLIEGIGGRYVEVYINTPLDVCEKRDIKGLYKLARKGIIKEFTGISDPFEDPINYDIKLDDKNINDLCDEIISY